MLRHGVDKNCLHLSRVKSLTEGEEARAGLNWYLEFLGIMRAIQRKIRVLLAADAVATQKSVNLAYAGTEFQLFMATDAQDAMSKLKSLKPEVVLIDSKIHSSSGIDFCEQLRSNSKFLQIRVVLFQEEKEVLPQGVKPDFVIRKPIEGEKLLQATRELQQEGASTVVEMAPLPAEAAEQPMELTEDLLSEEETAKIKAQSLPTELESVAPIQPLKSLDLNAIAASVLQEKSIELFGAGEELIGDDEQTDGQRVSKDMFELSHLPEVEAVQPEPRVTLDSDTLLRLAENQIRNWIDQNLAGIAEKIVKDEIGRRLQNK